MVNSFHSFIWTNRNIFGRCGPASLRMRQYRRGQSTKTLGGPMGTTSTPLPLTPFKGPVHVLELIFAPLPRFITFVWINRFTPRRVMGLFGIKRKYCPPGHWKYLYLNCYWIHLNFGREVVPPVARISIPPNISTEINVVKCWLQINDKWKPTISEREFSLAFKWFNDRLFHYIFESEMDATFQFEELATPANLLFICSVAGKGRSATAAVGVKTTTRTNEWMLIIRRRV